MAEQKYELQITHDLRPAYYDEFHCLAQQCHISCCKGWRIPFDKKDYLSLKHEKGSTELQKRLKDSMRRLSGAAYYAEFIMKDGWCPLLRGDGLCTLQCEKGHSSLPEVCRKFPRTEVYMPGYLERSLSPACESVLHLLWDLPEGTVFCSDPLPEKDCRTLVFASASPLNENLGYHFQEIRSCCIDMLQDRRHSLPERILRMGLVLKDLYDGETNIEQWLEFAHALADREEHLLEGLAGQKDALVLSIGEHHRLQLQGMNLDFKRMKQYPFGTSEQGTWFDAHTRFDTAFANREYFMENLMVAVFFHLHFPRLDSVEAIWNSFISFCNIYSCLRFIMVMGCCAGSNCGKDELFHAVVYASRCLLHNSDGYEDFSKPFFRNKNTTRTLLGHKAILLKN